MLRIGICDEDTKANQKFCEIIEAFLKKRNAGYAIFEFRCRNELERYLIEETFELDLLFLDVIIGKDSGIEIARDLLQKNTITQVIFLTNYIEYCSCVYDVEHAFFVRKDEFILYLPGILDKWKKSKKQMEKERIVLPVKGKMFFVMPMDIQYLERSKRNTLAVCSDHRRSLLLWVL